MSNTDFEVVGTNDAAPFTLKIHRGDGMVLLAMNWKNGQPPDNFIGFAIEYQEPGGNKFFALNNRLGFPTAAGAVAPATLSTMQSPIQKFRWVHFPFNAELAGEFTYRVSPVFMDTQDKLSLGANQIAKIELRRETYPGQLNVAFTRGFVASQAFVDRYQSAGDISQLLPAVAAQGLTFTPTHPNAAAALTWMGFEARRAILDVLDQANLDPAAQVRVVAYDLNLPDIVNRLKTLGPRLQIIIDNSGDHAKTGSAENQAETILAASAGPQNVKRQHMGSLQHNKFIAVDSPTLHVAVCGSTNFSWRAFYVQSNNAVVLTGKSAVAPFITAFDNYWNNGTVAGFGATPSVKQTDLLLAGIDAKVAYSPHLPDTALLHTVADDIATGMTSSLFYSLAFLYETPGVILDAIKHVTADSSRFVYGISDKKVGGIDVTEPGGNPIPIFPAALSANLPEPFKSEPTGGSGTRMHHKFLVIDFDKPAARVWVGSYNFSVPADTQNGENLLLIKDRRIAVSYMVEAVSIFDHYSFRVAQQAAATAHKTLQLKKPPRKAGDVTWFAKDYTQNMKIRDRKLFA
jgi:phosphatidylserine/phosphatidylglycerophosphate/cardiolipin synthase-like enzyme